MMASNFKYCTKCGERKKLSEYYKKSGRHDGKTSACKKCCLKDSANRLVKARKVIHKKIKTKICKICYENKKENEFNSRPDSIDGKRNTCKTCDAKRVCKYQKTPRGIIVSNRSKVRWISKNPKKRSASIKLNNALRDGKIIRKPCRVCGSTYRIHGHHPNYNRPLEVVWLCAQHHKEVHRK